MDGWQRLIFEMSIKLREIAFLCKGETGQDALWLAEQLKDSFLLQDAKQLLDSLKAALEAFRETENLAPNVFSFGGSLGRHSSKLVRARELQGECLLESEYQAELSSVEEQLRKPKDPDDMFGPDVFSPVGAVPVEDDSSDVDANRDPVSGNMIQPDGDCGGQANDKSDAHLDTAPVAERCTVDQVHFSALTDAIVQPGDYYTLRLFMGREEHRQIIEKIKQTAEKQLREDKTDIGVDIRKNQQVRVRITSPVAVIDDNEMTLPWTGNIREFSFMYFVPENVPGKTLPMTAHIYVDDVIATRLQIRVPLGQQGGQVSFSRQDVKEAFMSYSSKDREQVLTFVQGLSRSRPDLNIFLDVKSLRSGQDWQEKLSRKIDACQVLYLCWSRAAKESEVVDYEWRHAFKTKGAEAIEPVPLEPPQLCEPPKELNNRHFNDLYLMLRLAEKKVQELIQEDKKE